MDRYAAQFVDAGVASIDDVSRLTLKDLVGLGVTLVGHQKKIMNSDKTLRAHRQHTLGLTTADEVNEQLTTSVEYLA